MTFLLTLLTSLVGVLVLRTPLKKAPWLFYLLALLTVLLFVARNQVALPSFIDQPLFIIMQKAQVAESLFIIVMYVGVFATGSQVRSYLQPVRAQLSVVAGILMLGHVAAYLGSFGMRILWGAAPANGFLQASFCIALILLVLLMILGLTSFELLKRRMKTRHWIRLQRLAYVFYGLTYAHILLFLLPPALAGGHAAQISVLVYSLLFVPYVPLRLLRFFKDRKTA